MPQSLNSQGSVAASPQVTSNRPIKYRCWSEISMWGAVDAVNIQGMSVSKATKLHGIPRTTLSDHKLGKVLPGDKPGHPTLLTSSKEWDLVDFLLNSAKIGCARTRKEVIAIVGQMLSARGSKELVTNGWWNRFINWHLELALRTPSTLSISRARASTKECIVMC